MSDWLDDLSSEEREALKQSPHPDWMSPMLATLTEDRFSDPAWIFERKLDGERLLAFRDGDRLRLLTRNRKNALETYPEIGDTLMAQQIPDFVIDGEVVAFKGSVTSFSRLQQRMKIAESEEAHASGVAVYFYIFDALHVDGYDLDALPLRTRKRILRRLFDFKVPLHFTPHRNEDGKAFFEEACKKGWEGIIAKRADSHYCHGRSRDWLKFKCDRGQELVIAGFTEPKGERKGFGALLVGYYDNGDLCYAGKVGTGYDDRFLEEFRARLDKYAIGECPFADGPTEKNITWVRPHFVGEFSFTEWTEDGKLRHPRFLGLRRDKKPREVTRETADD
ncbi:MULTISPECIES: non-homologous end-joining DNA ligase [unclassified Wenzhouxiangella]|uniref:non-homologous end-joining DNA ligase n=1 Tax=unclassified Wenzhouxiangella TaxID=2613841 RepID=UPI000E32C0CD|nr:MULTISPECIES: non-homologous end-joining DNA ligase [unclassified Wenzhouxiangella]RFF26984.1 ATP-dependent DNA ligase [Wenzhouxiangella sp. 15181]RFP69496.1 ATP-dependent DNA ligase [Wenzhouxiangella sp. 15190]